MAKKDDEPMAKKDDKPMASADSPPPSSSGSSSSNGASASGDTTATVEPTMDSSEKEDFVWATLAAGSGLLHTYDVASAQVPNSGLSYRLAPVALFVADITAVYAPIGVGGRVHFGISPMKFDVQVDNSQVATPKGSFLDLTVAANLHLALSGKGRRAYRLIPELGLKFGSLSVNNHAANIVLSNSAVTPFVGVAAWLPLTEQLDIRANFGAGIIVAYSESPDVTAPEGGTGFMLGGGFGGRLWLTELIGVSLDAQFDFQRVGLSGQPNRQVPPDEDLTDPTITIKDLRTSFGVAVRL